MKCPFCGHEEDKVVDSRGSGDGASIRRRRECLGCGKRFTTYERELSQQFEREAPSREVGERVMKKLHALDPVAYVRFASVYREFKDVEQFMRELKDLLAQKAR